MGREGESEREPYALSLSVSPLSEDDSEAEQGRDAAAAPHAQEGVISLLKLCRPDVTTDCRTAPPQYALASWKPRVCMCVSECACLVHVPCVRGG